MIAFSWKNEDVISFVFPTNSVAVYFTASIIGGAFGVFWLFIVRKFPSQIIKASFFSLIGVCLAGSIFNFAAGKMNIAAGIALIVLAIWGALFYRAAESRVPFASVILEMGCTIISQNSGILWVAYGFLLLQIGWYVVATS